MKKLKIKIFASFMLLIAFLAIAGTISIIEFKKLSQSVHQIIEDNYKSIEASKTMLETLEREDSGILLLLLGESEEGLKIIYTADSLFLTALNVAKNNLTELNEEKYLKQTETNYLLFKTKWKSPIAGTDKQGNISWYKNDIHVHFLNTKQSINELMLLNQSSMYKRATELKEKSKRAIMPGIVAIISALIFSIILNFFITKYFVRPISNLADAVNNFREEHQTLRCQINSDDEIKKLEIAINNLLFRLSKK
ncbi:MAG: hypothetical protein A2275_16515 [Bacteroidetes bacterium RIFOXYA12_FULL_35_11]|nr:MAG: hypothetical protein A2X01_09650 [Bacteroidetes bacterium GWF2_35_48]OFY72344.1 MAG: hypothetical protein A2275_16515 [Bacteroidetes bacterium RIFOXYA12_FULL_35_11]OFY92163.1 MAG: hypothetical protein A2309_14060 [Bacteroidetes bacterium RIFOXYB2_FULL_35_7]OFZ00836.1 MAG: hypothetical protein A2491_19565 [Bacteroidetes bacterium RIFOXYC12_FULL_35_7]HBX50186.1 hypothetical protein [Bacteroidales bacterium]